MRGETRYRSEKQIESERRRGKQNQRSTKITQTGYLISIFCCCKRKKGTYVGGSLAASGTLFVFLMAGDFWAFLVILWNAGF